MPAVNSRPMKPRSAGLPRDGRRSLFAGFFSSLEICSLNRASLFIRAGDLLISMREPFIGARDQLDLLRGQSRTNVRGSVCLVFTEESMGASCQFAVN